MDKWAIGIAAVIFFVVAVLHLVRLLYPFSFMIAGVHIPLWASAIGFVVAGLLSAGLFYALTE